MSRGWSIDLWESLFRVQPWDRATLWILLLNRVTHKVCPVNVLSGFIATSKNDTEWNVFLSLDSSNNDNRLVVFTNVAIIVRVETRKAWTWATLLTRITRINQSIKRAINQSINQTNDQLNNQSINQAIGQWANLITEKLQRKSRTWLYTDFTAKKAKHTIIHSHRLSEKRGID